MQLPYRHSKAATGDALEEGFGQETSVCATAGGGGGGGGECERYGDTAQAWGPAVRPKPCDSGVVSVAHETRVGGLDRVLEPRAPRRAPVPHGSKHSRTRGQRV